MYTYDLHVASYITLTVISSVFFIIINKIANCLRIFSYKTLFVQKIEAVFKGISIIVLLQVPKKWQEFK